MRQVLSWPQQFIATSRIPPQNWSGEMMKLEFKLISQFENIALAYELGSAPFYCISIFLLSFLNCEFVSLVNTISVNLFGYGCFWLDYIHKFSMGDAVGIVISG